MKFEPGFGTYNEQIPTPRWIRAILYFSALAMVLGLVLPSFIKGDELATWEAWIYYPSMIIGLIVLSVAAAWFRRLSVIVDNHAIAFGYGRLRKRFTFDQIKSVESTPYSYMKYGGAGIRYARDGHRAWSVPFVHTGVEMKLVEGGKDRTYYVSSHHAEQLAEAIQSRIS